MEQSLRNQTIALAGVTQAAYLVKQIANRGLCDSEALTTSINSLFITDPETIESVYGGLEGIQIGLRQIIKQLDSGSSERDLELTKYIVTLLHLQKKLMKKPEMLETISKGIDRAKQQSEHFDTLHTNVIAGLADIYVNTLSTLTPRIMVKGDPATLNSPENANRIRALLLAAVRSTFLWQQAGGSRFKLLLGRGKVVAEAKQLLGSI